MRTVGALVALCPQVPRKKKDAPKYEVALSPLSGTYPLPEWGRAVSRAPKRSALSTFVAKIRCKRLRLATAEHPENFGILRTSPLRSSEKFALRVELLLCHRLGWLGSGYGVRVRSYHQGQPGRGGGVLR